MQPLEGKPQGFSIDVDAVVDVLEKGRGTLLDHVLHAKPHFHVLGESLDEREKMFRRPNIS